jgi:hypothetical protein
MTTLFDYSCYYRFRLARLHVTVFNSEVDWQLNKMNRLESFITAIVNWKKMLMASAHNNSEVNECIFKLNA